MDAPLTLLQVRIRDAGEATMVAAAGIDCIELVIGEQEAPSATTVRDIRRAFNGVLRLRLENLEPSFDLVSALAAMPADELAVAAQVLADVDFRPPEGVPFVAVVAPSDAAATVAKLGKAAGSVMLEVAAPGRLLDQAPIAALDAFASACRERGLAFGLGGGLETPDVSRLLLLEPDVLAFDTALRQDHLPSGALDRQALDAVRALVPKQNERAGRSAAPKKIAKVTDRIFVRNFEVSLAIGAYQAEHGKRQRVRFGIVAETVRAARPPHDMRDVFSYDIMIETIRVLAERPHVTFVETLAEEVAASILAHAEVVAVTVTVEKLDVINGSVGIEITRCRDAS